MPGNHPERRGRRVGRQAQVMPQQSSPTDQHEEATLSQVTSSLSLRYWMRMTEMAHVWANVSNGLWDARSGVDSRLTKKPRQKTPIRPSFCPLRRLRRLIAGSGRTKTMTSVTMFPAALTYQNGRLGIQVPGVAG